MARSSRNLFNCLPRLWYERVFFFGCLEGVAAKLTFAIANHKATFAFGVVHKHETFVWIGSKFCASRTVGWREAFCGQLRRFGIQPPGLDLNRVPCCVFGGPFSCGGGAGCFGLAVTLTSVGVIN